MLLAAWLVMASIPAPPQVGPDGLVGSDDWLVEPAPWALWWHIAYLLLGPPACYSLARILRPCPNGPRGERPWRHRLAAAGTAYGFVVLFFMQDSPNYPSHVNGTPVSAIYLGLAMLLGPYTLLRGVSAMTARARERRS